MATRLLLATCMAIAAAGCARSDAPPRQAARPDIVLPVEAQTFEALVPRNATLDSLLRQHQLPSALIQTAIESTRAVFDPRQIRSDRPYRLVRSVDGLLREFEYQIDNDRFLRIMSRLGEPEVLDAEVVPYVKDTAVEAIRGHIDAEHSSVIAAMNATGENVQLAMSLAEIFGGQVDFESDIQQGDSFEVLFEKSTREGEFAGYGEILGVRLVADGREHQAFRWTDPKTGRAAYYDQDGRSLKRAILRSPLRFVPRVTSGFSRKRLHPVHRTYRAHLGVDYGAAHGSPVVAVADGVVVSAGWAGGGGNQIRLKHSKVLETYYLHLSRFAKGVRKGAKVEQGDVIGYVGSTGTATGPHLDYRLKKNGVFVNPLVEHRKQPPGEPIAPSLLAAFTEQRDSVLGQLRASLPIDAARAKPDAVKAVR